MGTREIVRLLRQLGECIRTGRLLRGIPTSDEERARVLAGRDESAFDSQWIRAHESIQSELASAGVEVPEANNELRQAAYLTVYAQCSDSDLAAYVSDDFGMLGEALVAGYSDPWLSSMWHQYSKGAVPHSHLLPSESRLSDSIAAFLRHSRKGGEEPEHL